MTRMSDNAKEIISDCRSFQREIETFYNDPMTIAYGAEECSTLIERAHIKKCKRCRSKLAAARRR